jgi:hypothetical protein
VQHMCGESTAISAKLSRAFVDFDAENPRKAMTCADDYFNPVEGGRQIGVGELGTKVVVRN